MASTWFACTNTVLNLASLDPIDSTEDFDADGNAIDKYQRSAKYFVMLANQHLGLRAYRYFNTRKMQLLVSEGQSLYPLDTGISAENITVRTFFNNSLPNQSTGQSPNSQNRELRNWEYREYLKRYPDQSKITTGPPTRWILPPLARTNPTLQVQLSPIPDQNYTLEYQAKLNAIRLQQSSDTILFPPEYEHIIWEFGWSLLESDLGEGKQPAISAMAEKAASEVRLIASKPIDVRTAPRTMKIPSMGGCRRYYNSPLSVNAAGDVVD